MSAKGTIGFEEINLKLDRLIGALASKDDVSVVVDNMATKEDVTELREEIADVRAEMATKNDFKMLEMRMEALERKSEERFQEVMVALDGLAKSFAELRMEYIGITMQLSRHEEWIKLLAKKSGVKLPQ